MGASAGRVLIIPKGDWNAETTYTGLDMVRHNGASWICKNTCTNIEPTEANSANWQMMSRDGNDITVDSEVSDESTNPVQNKVIKKYVDEHTPDITVDSEMSDSSVNPVQNKVIKAYVDTHAPAITVDSEMSDTSVNPVQNKVIKAYADAKKVPKTLIENIMTTDNSLVLDTSGEGTILTPSTTWDPDNGGYRVSVNKCTSGALILMNISANIPAKSVVYILVTTLNKEVINVQSTSNLHENATDAVKQRTVNLNVQLPAGYTSTTINFMPIVFQNV